MGINIHSERLRKRRIKNNRHGSGSEFEEQRKVADHLDHNHPDVLWSASAGGARTSITEAKRLKASGYKKGFPDVFIYEPRGAYHGLSIEMKKEKGGRVSPDQKVWKERLTERGFKATVAKGHQMAIEILEEYLSLPSV